MLTIQVLVFVYLIVGVNGECRFASRFYKEHDLHNENQGVCPGQVQFNCPIAKYRTYNGSCNNLQYPEWGMGRMPLHRRMPPQYDNGIDALRWRSVTGGPLPKPRDVSLALFNEEKDEYDSPFFTSMHMAIGAFVNHDLTWINFGQNVTGCGTKFCEKRGECEPIKIPCGDPGFKEKKCLPFIRSTPVFCGHNRDQTNMASSYFDLSTVYGVNRDKTLELRDLYHDRGQMKMTRHPFDRHLKDLLPSVMHPLLPCHEVGGAIQCFDAGDFRVNAVQGLGGLHTLFNRAHNTIENKLHYLNPHWNGEKLFQESRKILGAIWQRIVYNEYLPLLMGPDSMWKYDLNLENGYNYWKGYNPKIQADATNEFTAGALRFGHSQIPNKERFTDAFFHDVKDDFFSEHSLRPAAFYATNLLGGSGEDAILRGMSDGPALSVRLRYAKQMTLHLFNENPPFGEGTDLASLDIKRGRDHGLKPYNAWRRFCGLKTADHFEDLPDISYNNRMRLQKIYKNVEDIDLLAGGLAEKHLFGSVVGPTFMCILGQQFHAVRAGDRFWHETSDKLVGFTQKQLKEIRKYSLAYLICENGDRIMKIQPNVMMQPLSRVAGHVRDRQAKLVSYLYRGGPNEYMSCHDMNIPDLSPWKEGGGCGH